MKPFKAYFAVFLSVLFLLGGVCSAEETAEKVPAQLTSLGEVSAQSVVKKAEHESLSAQEHSNEGLSEEPSLSQPDSTLMNNPVAPAAKVGRHVNEDIDLLSMVVSLGVVLAIIVIVAFLLKRIQGGKTSLNGLKLISSLHLGTKEKIVVVQAGEKQWLLGVTPQQINLLSELTEPLTSSDSESTSPELPSVIAFLLKGRSAK